MKGGIEPLPHITTQGQAKRDAKIRDEEGKYRLRQFYMILLKADKARLLALQNKQQTDIDKSEKSV
ncbi:MAG: hypothetical protein A3C35_02275 [Omnitrophica bacterium RIFCSPHIGHO2_02_FULL_46_11]|nr:MAG: hypothetical protein A3C35_02275 [Omnitrophica bacterium RIFCSPHIGHO2_02_FULL_46_11]